MTFVQKFNIYKKNNKNQTNDQTKKANQTPTETDDIRMENPN